MLIVRLYEFTKKEIKYHDSKERLSMLRDSLDLARSTPFQPPTWQLS